MKKPLILLAGLVIMAMVAVPAIIMQPEDSINPTTQSVNALNTVTATAVLPQDIAVPTQTPVASEPGITYELEVDTAKITLTLPREYEMLPMGQDYGDIPVYDRYVFLNDSTGVSFWVEWYSKDTEKQALLMRKMRDTQGMVILDNLTFGSYSGTARYQTDYNYDHHFLILGNNGYAYQFQMRLPEDQGQNSPPEEALKILETLQITGK